MNNKRVLCVLKGYLELNDEEKEEFIKEINKTRRELHYDTLLLERIQKAFSHNLGPTNDTNCLCCGKG
ncbi:hypothetical protein [Aureispira sp. CCB-QB1]|uniref:hypothetical protein n=1 Tax=Aureispira sp. CCB-QB1 TaxID=1313421 RepID=UPI000697ADE4|nr:hypothetical protein [Aureispira sp. CCB-QB1]